MYHYIDTMQKRKKNLKPYSPATNLWSLILDSDCVMLHVRFSLNQTSHILSDLSIHWSSRRWNYKIYLSDKMIQCTADMSLYSPTIDAGKCNNSPWWLTVRVSSKIHGGLWTSKQIVLTSRLLGETFTLEILIFLSQCSNNLDFWHFFKCKRAMLTFLVRL